MKADIQILRFNLKIRFLEVKLKILHMAAIIKYLVPTKTNNRITYLNKINNKNKIINNKIWYITLKKNKKKIAVYVVVDAVQKMKHN